MAKECSSVNSLKEMKVKVKGGSIQLIAHEFESNDILEAFKEAKY